MTIGDKIRYFRTKQGMTQNTLAELSEIHPVSIRKYETNKMQPSPSQMEKIANALNISQSALKGISDNYLRMETVGDLMGFLMLMYESGLVQVKGTRNPDGSVKKETMSLKFSPIFSNLLSMSSKDTSQKLDNITINILNSNILDDFLTWDKTSYIYTKSVLSATENDIAKIEELLTYKTHIELEILSSIKPIEELYN